MSRRLTNSFAVALIEAVARGAVDFMRNAAQSKLMKKSSTLGGALDDLTRRARAAGLTDSAWAQRAGLRKETLSRLRSRDSCDFQTLESLARVVGTQVGVLPAPLPGTTSDGHFPAQLNRKYEEALARLCVSGNHDVQVWLGLGPRFFMAGLAVMTASAPGLDRRALLALAEQLHPGASESSVFNRWLQRTPVSPSRFFPMLDAEAKHAA